MAIDSDRFFIITGGPGSGKTTLIETLARRGFARSLEAGRSILMDQMAIGGNAVHWGDQRMFAELMLQHEMRSYHMAEAEEGPVLFDRGIPELSLYFALVGSASHRRTLIARQRCSATTGLCSSRRRGGRSMPTTRSGSRILRRRSAATSFASRRTSTGAMSWSSCPGRH